MDNLIKEYDYKSLKFETIYGTCTAPLKKDFLQLIWGVPLKVLSNTKTEV